jgi:hypothetical protein
MIYGDLGLQQDYGFVFQEKKENMYHDALKQLFNL